MPEIKHLFFDLDHTLWDFEKNASECLSEIFHLHTFPDFITFSEFNDVFSKINQSLWNQLDLGKISSEYLRTQRFAKVFAEMGYQLETDLSNRMNLQFQELLPLQSHLIEGANELLEKLQKSKFQLHIISNGNLTVQKQKMQSSGILKYFNHIITYDLCGFRKPSTEIFDHAINTTNADKQESLMIGDNLIADIEGANNAGITAIHFDISGQSTQKHAVKSLSEIIPTMEKISARFPNTF